MKVSRLETNLALTLFVNDAAGAVTGLSPTVMVRDPTVTDRYLDFNDDTFKTSGWTQKTATLTEIGGGVYEYLLDVTAITNLTTTVNYLIAEYSDGSNVSAENLELDKEVDAGVTSELATKRLNAYARGKVDLVDVGGGDFDLEYYDEAGTGKLFENRKTATQRTPQ